MAQFIHPNDILFVRVQYSFNIPCQYLRMNSGVGWWNYKQNIRMRYLLVSSSVAAGVNVFVL